MEWKARNCQVTLCSLIIATCKQKTHCGLTTTKTLHSATLETTTPGKIHLRLSVVRSSLQNLALRFHLEINLLMRKGTRRKFLKRLGKAFENSGDTKSMRQTPHPINLYQFCSSTNWFKLITWHDSPTRNHVTQ